MQLIIWSHAWSWHHIGTRMEWNDWCKTSRVSNATFVEVFFTNVEKCAERTIKGYLSVCKLQTGYTFTQYTQNTVSYMLIQANPRVCVNQQACC